MPSSPEVPASNRDEAFFCTHLNAEFRRIARRDKKSLLIDQCKEIEDNNRIGKTRDLVKKSRDTEGSVAFVTLEEREALSVPLIAVRRAAR